uniref:Integrase catalytic domain-containing protein n=1 Tax=Timema douglasi TaxID=61478 RepID=A0A7R8Z9X6_TIMDO|nr:unnamed protein product [Timema douglasi]
MHVYSFGHALAYSASRAFRPVLLVCVLSSPKFRAVIQKKSQYSISQECTYSCADVGGYLENTPILHYTPCKVSRVTCITQSRVFSAFKIDTQLRECPTVKEKLCREVVHRFQSPHESLRNFVLSITEAARVLNTELKEPELVDTILENVFQLTRRHFVLSNKPSSIQDLYVLASLIEGTLLSEEEYLHAHVSRTRVGSNPGATNSAPPFGPTLLGSRSRYVRGGNPVGSNPGNRVPRDLFRTGARSEAMQASKLLRRARGRGVAVPIAHKPRVPSPVISVCVGPVQWVGAKLNLGNREVSFSFALWEFVSFATGNTPLSLFLWIVIVRLFKGYKASGDMCFFWGIKHVTTSPYNPSSNHVERFNRNLNVALTIFPHHNHSHWDKHLDFMNVALNSAFHESVKATSASIFMNRDLNHPLLTTWDIDPLLSEAYDRPFEEKCELAFRNLQKSQRKVASTYNRGRVPVLFKVGDNVAFKCFPLSSAVDKTSAKLAYKWSGPWCIDKFLTPVSVQLKDMADPSITRRAHRGLPLPPHLPPPSGFGD